MEKLNHWWNGRFGRLARVDVILYRSDEGFVVERRIGGVEGRTVCASFADHDQALTHAATLRTESDGWRDL